MATRKLECVLRNLSRCSRLNCSAASFLALSTRWRGVAPLASSKRRNATSSASAVTSRSDLTPLEIDAPRSSTPAPPPSSSSTAAAAIRLTLDEDLPKIKCCRMSNLFMPYLSSLPDRGSEEDNSKNNRLLVHNGFVFPSQQGMFHLLPLGVRVLDKLKRVIVEELENVGCQELAMSTLTHSRLWEQSGRWDDAGPELFRLKDRRDAHLCLAPTCEENITAMMGEIRRHISFKHLPIKLFQVSTKYRDEVSAKNGLLRGREFLMKDLYTFDQDEASSTSTYDSVTSAYERIFSRLSLPVYRVIGSPGKIGGRLSHEFQLPSTAGEDEIIVCQNCEKGVNVELLETEAERQAWKCDCDEPKILRTATIELGHTFLLGLKYSTPFESTYRDASGKDVLLEMGCYGIGVSRLMAACAEVSDPISQSLVDLIWPRPLAPFQVAILPPKKGSKESTAEVVDAALQLAVRLSAPASSSSSSEVIVDDRLGLTIGRRVRDVKRIGVPFIVVVGARFKSDAAFELIDVYEGKTTFLEWDDLLSFLTRGLRN